MAEIRRRKDAAVLAGVSLPTVDRWVDRYPGSGGVSSTACRIAGISPGVQIRGRDAGLCGSTPAGVDRRTRPGGEMSGEVADGSHPVAQRVAPLSGPLDRRGDALVATDSARTLHDAPLAWSARRRRG
ncbi:hypothetical protein ACPPVO_33290 [Dactylosporangium sp. McL0621]|uniref:hypothetical protein n=1 Tax=Dactylosporangium sp. McL0621 TaxID=3415678 RepID=UPI003CF8185D